MSLCSECNAVTSVNPCNLCTPCSAPGTLTPTSPTLFPVKVKKIVDCINLVDNQNEYLGEMTFNLSCNTPSLSNITSSDICINGAGITYDNIGVDSSQITVNINGQNLTLTGQNPFNGYYNYFEGKTRSFEKCCCEENIQWYKKIVSISGIETYMNNGVITVCGTIGGESFIGETTYDGYLNKSQCPLNIVNNAQVLQTSSGVTTVVGTSSDVITKITPGEAALNAFNANSYYGFLCLPNMCKSSEIIAVFNNQFTINCVQPNECYDCSGTFTAFVYGNYNSSLCLYSILEQNNPLYAEVYNQCAEEEEENYECTDPNYTC